MTAAQYSKFLDRLKNQIDAAGGLDHDQKKKIVRVLIHKIVVTMSGFEMHYFVGVDQIKKGEPTGSPLKSLPKKNSVFSSFILLNGALNLRSFELRALNTL